MWFASAMYHTAVLATVCEPSQGASLDGVPACVQQMYIAQHAFHCNAVRLWLSSDRNPTTDCNRASLNIMHVDAGGEMCTLYYLKDFSDGML